MRIDVLVDVKTILGEGPLWDVEEERLYWIDSFGGNVFRCTHDGREVRAWDLPQKEPRAHILRPASGPLAQNESDVVVEKWNAEHRAVRIVSKNPANVVLRVLNYPAWRVTVNGAAVTPSHPKGTEEMIVPVPAGESEVRIDFTRTADRTLGGWISIASLISSLFILVWKRRWPIAT